MHTFAQFRIITESQKTLLNPALKYKYTNFKICKKFTLGYNVSCQALLLSFGMPDWPIFLKPRIYFNNTKSNSCLSQIFSAFLL